MCRNVFLIILSVAVTIIPSYTQAQIVPTTDSLRAELRQSTGEQRVEVLLQLSDQTRRTSINSATAYAKEALEISERRQNEVLKAEAHRMLGSLLASSGQNPAALQHLLKAKEIFEQIGDLSKEAMTLKNLGALYKNQADNHQALEYYFSALNLSEQLNDRQNLPDILVSIGIINERLNQPEKSVASYKRALRISEQKDAPSDIAIICMSLGDLYASQGQSDKALQMMGKALKASERLPGAHAQATILMSMSAVYNDKQSYRQALDANKKALALARSMPDNMLESLALTNIANVYHEQGNYANANAYLLEARPLLEKVGSRQRIIDNGNRLARNYLIMDDVENAIIFAERAYKRAYQAEALEEARASLQLLAEAYQKKGDYEHAIDAQTRLIAVNDSLFNREQTRQIAEMQTRYETKQKEQEIALLQQKQEKAALVRNAFIAGIILVIIIGLLVYNRQRLKIKKNRVELENTRLKEQQLKQDLEFKNKQLTTHSLNLVQKNETMKELKENISKIKKEAAGGNITKKLSGIEHLVDYSFSLDEDWEEFRLYFEEVHTGFFDALKKQYPDLTANELRLSALVKLNLTSKEIATILGITPDSVKTARYRLRKKLDMDTEENLSDLMINLEKHSGAKGDNTV